MDVTNAVLAAIYKSFSTIFNEAFAGAKTMWERVAMETTSAGESVEYVWLGDMPVMREWIGDRAIRQLAAHRYTIVNKDYEATVEVDRNKIEDDQVGIYTPMILELGRAAAQHPDILVFGLLSKGFSEPCYDGQYFFDSDHPVGSGTVSNTGGGSGTAWFLLDTTRAIKPLILQRRKRPEFVAMDRPDDENAFMRKKFRYGVDDRKNVGFAFWQLAYGSKQTLNGTNYAAARGAMMGFKNDEGVPLGIVPNLLVVPPTLEAAGRALLENEFDSAGASNTWYRTAELLVVPWLA